MAAVDAVETSPPEAEDFGQKQHGWRFYAVFPGLCLSALLGALDTAILGLSLPTISAELEAGELYIWAVNGFYLATAVVQPLVGQLADVFGRRKPMVGVLGLFILGSGICGGANSIGMLIAGRILQGLGGGGITVLIYIIVADLVPLRWRQKYLAIVMACYALGMFIGPIIGGIIVSRTSWRWIFYINLPIGGVAVVLVFAFLNLKYERQDGLLPSLRRVDWLGTALLSAAVASILIALTWGGTLYPWSNANVLVPLCLGFGGLILFGLHQRFLSSEPVIPPRLSGTLTSLLGFVLTFFQGVCMAWFAFMLPVYFQILQDNTPLSTGVNLLALSIPITPSGIIGGLVIAKTGRYKPTLITGLALTSVAAGCMTLLDTTSSAGMNIGFQIIGSVGMGLALQSTLPPVQAVLAEEDAALASGAWAFVRSFGLIWGAAIPAAVFNSRVDSELGQINNETIRGLLAAGGAYEHATKSFIDQFDGDIGLRNQILDLYSVSLKETWQVLIGFALLAMPFAIFIPEVHLRKHLDTKFGLKNREKEQTAESPEADTSLGEAGGALPAKHEPGPIDARDA